jgi:hypothetical protein
MSKKLEVQALKLSTKKVGQRYQKDSHYSQSLGMSPRL